MNVPGPATIGGVPPITNATRTGGKAAARAWTAFSGPRTAPPSAPAAHHVSKLGDDAARVRDAVRAHRVVGDAGAVELLRRAAVARTLEADDHVGLQREQHLEVGLEASADRGHRSEHLSGVVVGA